MIFSNEIWRDIPGFGGRYQASSEGRIRNRGGKIFRPLTGRPIPYKSVVLRGDDKSTRRHLVHRLVLETFVSPRPEGQFCRHLNGNGADNRVMNLAWGTVAENVADRTKHGTENSGERNHCAKLTRAQVNEIRASQDKQSLLAIRYGISACNVSAIVNYRTWK